MTKVEITGIRDLQFSGWIRKELPDSSTGFMATDIDFVFSNYKTKKFMMLEIKTRGKEVESWQENMFKNINKWIKKGIDKNWTYYGFHLITFEGTNFYDGQVWFDNILINEEDLIDVLSMRYNNSNDLANLIRRIRNQDIAK